MRLFAVTCFGSSVGTMIGGAIALRMFEMRILLLPAMIIGAIVGGNLLRLTLKGVSSSEENGIAVGGMVAGFFIAPLIGLAVRFLVDW